MKTQILTLLHVPIFCMLLSINCLGQVEVENILKIKPEMAESLCLTDVIQMKNGDFYALCDFPINSAYDTQKNLYKISNNKLEKVYTAETQIEFFDPIGDIIYFMSAPGIKSYSTVTSDSMGFIPANCFHGPTGFTGINDTLMAYTGIDESCLFVVNTNSSYDTSFIYGDPIYERDICYDSFNNEVLISDLNGAIYSYALNENASEKVFDAELSWRNSSWNFTCDSNGNIFMVNEDSAGVFLLNRSTNEMSKIATSPQKPGALFFNKHDNSIIVPDIADSSIYKIMLANNAVTKVNKDKPDFKNISIYPNPSNGVINITYNIQEAISGKIQLFNSDGRQVYELRRNNWQLGNNTFTLNQQHLNPGIYFITISSSNNTTTEMLIIE